MKSSKGKVPVGGKTKKVTMAAHGARKQKEKDPVEVFCRVRPLREDEGESCMTVVRENRLQIDPPENSLAFKSGQKNPTQHTFKRVLNPNSSQTDVFNLVGCPLTEQLLQGKNGLLFAYGITNSGKTYTMTGEPSAPGVLPRCLDVVFNSIAEVQAPKYVFRPDGSNGYNIFPESDARIEQTRNRGKKVSPRMRAETDFSELLRVPEPRKVTDGVDEDSQYAVFVSYVEIYNNYAFDLLEEVPVDSIAPRPPKSKSLREDIHHNMYVSNVTEVEVKSTEEAFEALHRGQKRRRVAMTTMNTESSRSHSVFTIRLVQAPLNHSGDEVIQDKNLMVISQLSLVDLAGSERSTRTHCTGDRLREANNINANLMVLRTCMETLRDNQIVSGPSKIVPYRDSKLTHLFKNYFDGQGKVAMIVCVSPRSGDYDETIHVMRFAEVTQEVMVDRPETVKKQINLAPGRHRANMLFKAALKETRVVGEGGGSGERTSSAAVAEKEAPHPYLLALGVLSVQKYLSAECKEESLTEFRESLDKRGRIRIQLIDDLKKKQRLFREQLCTMETQLVSLQASCDELGASRKSGEKKEKENMKLKSIVASQDERVARLQAELERSHALILAREHELAQVKEQLNNAYQEKDMLLRTTEMYEVDKRELQDELSQLQHRALQEEEAKDAIKKTMTGFVSQEKEKFERLAKHMKYQQKDLQTKKAQIQQVRELIRNSPRLVRTPLRDTTQIITGGKSTATPSHPVGKSNNNAPPVKGKGRKRSASENWLEHKPSSTVENGGVLQPQLKKKRTVSTPKPKDFQKQGVGRYCLQHQEEDSDGDIKTALYKGDIQQTRGGGTSVTFTGIETHRHGKPNSSVTPKVQRRSARLGTKAVAPMRPTSAGAGEGMRGRPSSENSISSLSSTSTSSFMDQRDRDRDGFEEDEESSWTDVESRCAIAVEGRPGAEPALTHQAIKKK